MNEEGQNMLMSVSEKITAAMKNGQFEQATQLWGTAEGIVFEVCVYATFSVVDLYCACLTVPIVHGYYDNGNCSFLEIY